MANHIEITAGLARACRDSVTRSLVVLEEQNPAVSWGRSQPRLAVPSTDRIALDYTASGGMAGQLITLPGPANMSYPHYVLKLNPILLLQDPSEMINNTIPHEVAHAVVRHTWGRGVESHGWQWAMVMWMLGFDNPGSQQYHSMDIAACKGKRVKGINKTMSLEDL